MSAHPILVVQNSDEKSSDFSSLTVGDQGWGCSPIKRVRELGSQRCKAVGLISIGDVLVSEGKDPLVREERGFDASGQPVV